MNELKLTEYRNNASICFNVDNKSALRKLGFSFNQGVWAKVWEFDRYTDMIVTAADDKSYWRIDIIDSAGCQPYAYQRILETDPDNEYAKMVKMYVDSRMLLMKYNGLICGWELGDYV